MSFPDFPDAELIDILGDPDLVHVGRHGARNIEGILSIDESIESDGEYGVLSERIRLDVLVPTASLMRKSEEIRKGTSAKYVIIAIPPADDGMVSIELERKV